MKGETSVVEYSLMSKGAEVDVDETKEKFSLNMVGGAEDEAQGMF